MANPPIPVRLTDENRAWIQERACAEDRSLNYTINKTVEEARLDGARALTGKMLTGKIWNELVACAEDSGRPTRRAAAADKKAAKK